MPRAAFSGSQLKKRASEEKRCRACVSSRESAPSVQTLLQTETFILVSCDGSRHRAVRSGCTKCGYLLQVLEDDGDCCSVPFGGDAVCQAVALINASACEGMTPVWPMRADELLEMLRVLGFLDAEPLLLLAAAHLDEEHLSQCATPAAVRALLGVDADLTAEEEATATAQLPGLTAEAGAEAPAKNSAVPEVRRTATFADDQLLPARCALFSHLATTFQPWRISMLSGVARAWRNAARGVEQQVRGMLDVRTGPELVAQGYTANSLRRAGLLASSPIQLEAARAAKHSKLWCLGCGHTYCGHMHGVGYDPWGGHGGECSEEHDWGDECCECVYRRFPDLKTQNMRKAELGLSPLYPYRV